MMDMQGIPLAALLAMAAEKSGADSRGIPEAQVERLRDFAERYGAPNPFRAGDLVTPRRDGTVSGAGDVHVVLETIPAMLPRFGSDACCAQRRLDTRVAWITKGGKIGSIWVESFELERWPTDAGAASAAADPAAAA